MGWVTINGNHVLIGEDGRSLTDSRYSKDKDFDDDDDFLSKEEMDAIFREAAEAMNRGINLSDLRAEKIGIDSDELGSIEEIAPELKKMSAEEVRKEFYSWWFKNHKNEIDWKTLPTKIDLILQYLQKDKSNNEELRQRMAQDIVNFEARRDEKGNVKLYHLPKGDGGGAYEVAGVDVADHPEMAAKLRDLVAQGKFKQAEREAVKFIASYTDRIASYADNPSIEFYLRDTAFNRGPTGATRILQKALGIEEDGKMGPKTLAKLKQAEKDPQKLLNDLNRARVEYEDKHVGSRPLFKAGLTNRWNNVLKKAKTYLDE